MKRDKQRVEGEQWSADQLQEYLNFTTTDGLDRDFHCLYRAYTRMNEQVFSDFVELFQQQGRNLNAKNLDGRTLAELIAEHKNSGEYLTALEKACA